MVTVPLTAGTDLHSLDEFKQLIVKQSGDSVVRLEDVANVTLGSENYDFNVAFGGVRSVFIGIKVAPEANILDVAKRVREAFPDLQNQLPTGVTGQIVYDSTDFINTSIKEVVKTLVEALVIVAVVIYLFLGTFRAVLVPLVAMPLSLVGAFFIMLMLGYSINLLTLLALVLAIGLVVDDAIIVVENVDRHMKEEAQDAAAGRADRGARAGQPHHRDGGGAGRGVRADRLPGRPHRRAVHRVRVHAGRLGVRLGHRRADAVADDVRQDLLVRPGQRQVRQGDRPRVREGARHLHALAAQPAGHVPRADRDGLHRAGACWSSCSRCRSRSWRPRKTRASCCRRWWARPRRRPTRCRRTRSRCSTSRTTMPEYKQMFQITGVPTVNAGIGGVLLKDWGDRTRSAHEIQMDLQAQVEQDRRRPRGRVPVPAAARLVGPAGAVRHHDDGAVREPQHRGAAGDRQGAGLGQVLLHRRRPEARRAAGHGGGGPRQDRRAGHDAAGRGPGARRRAGRRLRQLLLHRGPLVQGDPAGAAGRPPEPVQRAGLLHQDAQRRPDPGQHDRAPEVQRAAGVDHALPAAELGDDLGAWPACRRARR